MTGIFKNVLCAWTPVAGLAACGGKNSPQNSSISVGGGSSDMAKEKRFDFLLYLANDMDGGREGGLCTAFLVTSRIAITAAHCLLDKYGQDLVHPSRILLMHDRLHRRIHLESYSVGSAFDSDWDVAILRLDADMPDVTPGNFLTSSGIQPQEGDRIEMIGYGRRAESEDAPSGSLVAGSNTIASMTWNKIIVKGTVPENYDRRGENQGNAMLLTGDSGGPLLWQNKIIGLASERSRGNILFSARSVFLNFSRPDLRQFIDAKIAELSKW